jgi:hypothetical protein
MIIPLLALLPPTETVKPAILTLLLEEQMELKDVVYLLNLKSYRLQIVNKLIESYQKGPR